MKKITLLVFLLSLTSIVFGQEVMQRKSANDENLSQHQKDTYAYIVIEGQFLSKKLKVKVDLGDTPEQIEKSKEYSDFLTNKKSYAAVLNHMGENDFKLVETLDYNDIYSGSGGTTGIVFIMKKRSIKGNNRNQ